ncbi:MAG TPA: FtsX-like permease family protein, partial [Candidatus Dormibacteraeota bacterium]
METVRNLARRKLRNGLTIGGIVIGIMALTTMGAMSEKTTALLDGGRRFFSDHIVVGDSGSGFGGGLIQVDTADVIERVDGVAAAFPTIGVPGHADPSFSLGGGLFVTATAAGFERYEHFQPSVARGRQLDQARRGEVVLGADAAKELNATLGGQVRLPTPPRDPSTRPDYVGHSFLVVGILEKTLTAPDSFASVTFADGQMLLGDVLPTAVRGTLDPSRIASGISVFGRAGVDLDQLARKIASEVPGVRATPPSELVKAFEDASTLFTAITTGSALLALVVGGLSVVNTMVMAVTERVREIGVKKVVGAHTWDILREYLIEATVIGLVGGALGTLLGWAFTSAINAYTDSLNLTLFLLSPRLVVFALLFSVGLGA